MSSPETRRICKKNIKKRRANRGNEGEEFKGEGEAAPPLHSPSPEEPTLAGFGGKGRNEGEEREGKADGWFGREGRLGLWKKKEVEEVVRKAPPRRRLPEIAGGGGKEGGSDGEGSKAEGVGYL